MTTKLNLMLYLMIEILSIKAFIAANISNEINYEIKSIDKCETIVRFKYLSKLDMIYMNDDLNKDYKLFIAVKDKELIQFFINDNGSQVENETLIKVINLMSKI